MATKVDFRWEDWQFNWTRQGRHDEMMHQGEIVERGNHEQLLAIPGGRYAALWQEQSDEPGMSQNRSSAALHPLPPPRPAASSS